MYVTFQLKAMAVQPKMRQILYRGVLPMLFQLAKYYIHAIQVRYFGKLKTALVASGKQLRYHALQVDCSQKLILM